MTETVQKDEFQCGELSTRETDLKLPYEGPEIPLFSLSNIRGIQFQSLTS